MESNYNLNVASGSSQIREETLVIFKETMFASLDSGSVLNYKPVATQKANELAYTAILQTFEANKYLNLPRISSSHHFLDLCPSWSPSDYFEAG